MILECAFKKDLYFICNTHFLYKNIFLKWDIFYISIYVFLCKKSFFSVKKIFNIKLFFHIKIFFQKKLFFKLVLQQMNNHIFLQNNSNYIVSFNPLNANPTKWSNTLKQFIGCCRRIFWVCLNILWGWRLKG